MYACLTCSQAVANSTDAAFFHATASEFVQKWLGQGAQVVRDLFRTARDNAPSIIFIDGMYVFVFCGFSPRLTNRDRCRRYQAQRLVAFHSTDREIQRILIELLTQMDGFDQRDKVVVLMATNRYG